ncbi:MAG: MutS-related protein [Clostridium sp.]
MKFLDNEQRLQIGFDFLMEELQTITFYGSEEKKSVKPYKKDEQAKLITELDDLDKFINAINLNKKKFSEIQRALRKIKDIRNSIKRMLKEETLDEVELYEIKYFSIIIEDLKIVVDSLNLQIEAINFKSLNEVIKILDPENKNLSTFYVYDGYSEYLKDIREKKSKIEKKIFIEEDDEKVTKLKDERLQFVIEEENEELRIRKELTKTLKKFGQDILYNIKCIGNLDFKIAKANMAIKHEAVRPSITDDMEIELIDAFNPEVKAVLSKKGKSFTNQSISLRKGTTVITGANMGGKSVTLKTIVLNLLLGQMGFFIFAKSATFPILDFIHFVSDDMQSISKGLSTFGAEIIKLKELVECAKRGNGFIALDEFARGTNPKEGFYLVKSVALYLNKFSSISLISTHYDGVVEENMEHYQVIGLKNMDFDSLKYKIDLNKTKSVETIQQHMEYRLEKVSRENKVPKDALNIAMLLGLDKDIVNIAKNFYEENQKLN